MSHMNNSRRTFFQRLFGVGVVFSGAQAVALPPTSFRKIEQLETLKVGKNQKYIVRMCGNWPPENLEQMQGFLRSHDLDCIVVDDGLADVFVLPTN